ncbi:hypothetical protein DH2020_043819 [Rehmannia glutinosa]|uniref:MACPF domain-containing protein n=1 Tax=Rehmannia glutinosa TaxID=99300 RepID=A0ABR0UIK9_REHGL
MSDGIVQKALSSLGKGFDLSSDFRLKYCKGENRLILLNETDTRKLSVPGFGSFENVSVDIKCDKGERTRYQSHVLDFNQMSEFFNQKCSVPGKIPTGLFNSMFGFQSGSWAVDAANTKYLGLDGYFIILFNVHIDRYPLILADEVRNAVPSTWDPSALARFIEKYGTHIIVGLSLGGHDVVLVKQDKSSNIEPSQLKNHLDNLGDQLFTGTCTFSPHQCKTNKDKKHKAPQAFNVFDPQPNLLKELRSITTKDVTSGNTPVTGMRLYLEGIKGNRLGIHLQHFVNPPVLLQDNLQHSLLCRGSDQIPDNTRYFEPIQWKKFSHICTAPVKYDPKWSNPGPDTTAFIVTGAQLHVKKHDSKSVLHLRLAYSRVSNCYVVQSNWMQFASENNSMKSGFFSSISTSLAGNNPDKEKPGPVIVDSGVYPTGPPVATQKFLRFVDTSQMCRGPSDNPGHWLVTGAKLDLEKGKICLRVKFSLLNLSS